LFLSKIIFIFLVLLSVQNLLVSPEPQDPQDAIVAKQYMADVELYNVKNLCLKKSQFWLLISKLINFN
jgi:ubiquitin-protein ligase